MDNQCDNKDDRVKSASGTTDDQTGSIPQAPRITTFMFPPDETKTKILTVLEKIRQCNVNQDIDIPELVICGKQSSGKPSVLEAITGLDFPKGDGGPCTRFVIEIRLFPDPEQSYMVSKVRFRPTTEDSKGDGDNAGYKEQVLGNHTEVNQIITEASTVMAITEEKTFSPHVLSIEYHFKDPQARTSAPRLTLIDLPGLTEVGDSDFPEEVTRRYVARNSALILAVVDAVNDLETHKILKIAQKFDPSCRRTFGIITKPDLTMPSSDLESVWVREVLHPEASRWFKMGSHVLFNRNSIQIKQGDLYKPLNARDEQECLFFGKEFRSGLNTDNPGDNRKLANGWFKLHNTKKWGVVNLREHLLSLLSDMAVRQLDSIYNGIEVALQKREKELGELEEKDPKKQMKELDDTIYTLRKLASQASSGNYTQEGFFAISRDGPEWLRSKIVDQGTIFAEKMRSEGHKSDVFMWKPDEKLPTDPMAKEVTQMLELLRRTQSGLQLGEFNPDRVQLLLQEYSGPWIDLAKNYVETCHDCCVNFARQAVRYSIKNEGFAERFFTCEILGKLEERKEDAMDALKLIEGDRGDAFLSMNPGMWMGNRELMSEMAKTLAYEPKIQNPTPMPTPPSSPTQQKQTKPGQQSTQNPAKSNQNPGKLGTQAKEEFGELERVSRVNALKILHNMMIVYKKCRETFIDNILVQVVQRNLVKNFESLFDHAWTRDEAQLRKIIGDRDKEWRLKRQEELKKEVDKLTSALEDLRPMLGSFSSFKEQKIA